MKFGILSAAVLCAALLPAASVAQQSGAVTFNTIGLPEGIATLKSAWGQIQTLGDDRIVATAEPKYGHLANVMRITVKPGDLGPWKSGERAEVAGLKDAQGHYTFETEASGTQYYAFSIYIPKSWTKPEIDPRCKCRWGTPLQLHGPDKFGASPTLSISLVDKYALGLNAGNLDELGKYHGKPIEFSDGGQISYDAWDDFMIKITYSRSNNGAITVWRRTAGAKKFKKVADVENVATLQSMPSVEATPEFRDARPSGGTREYWKQGFYRSTSPDFNTVLYETGLVRASSFAAAEQAAFSTHDGE